MCPCEVLIFLAVTLFKIHALFDRVDEEAVCESRRDLLIATSEKQRLLWDVHLWVHLNGDFFCWIAGGFMFGCSERRRGRVAGAAVRTKRSHTTDLFCVELMTMCTYVDILQVNMRELSPN